LQEYKNEIDFYEKRSELGELFYKKVGIIRKKQELLEAEQAVQKTQRTASFDGRERQVKSI